MDHKGISIKIMAPRKLFSLRPISTNRDPTAKYNSTGFEWAYMMCNQKRCLGPFRLGTDNGLYGRYR